MHPKTDCLLFDRRSFALHHPKTNNTFRKSVSRLLKVKPSKEISHLSRNPDALTVKSHLESCTFLSPFPATHGMDM